MSDFRRISGYEGWQDWNFCGFCGGPLVSYEDARLYNRKTGLPLPNKRCDRYTVQPFGDVFHDWIYRTEDGDARMYEGV